MEQKFPLSSKLTSAESLLVVGFTGALVTCALCAAASLRVGSALEFSEYGRLFVYLAATALVCLVLRLVLTKEMRQTEYVVSTESVSLVSPQRTVTIPFESVTRLRYVRMPFSFNFGLLGSPGGAIRFSARIVNHRGLIFLVKETLDKKGMSGTYREAEIERYLRDAAAAERADARIRALAPMLSGAAALICATSMLTALYLWLFPLFLSLLWSVFGLLMLINAVRYAEYSIARRPEPGGNDADDPASTAPAYLLSGGIVFVLYLVCGIALKAAFFR
jgi:hypothetical protein